MTDQKQIGKTIQFIDVKKDWIKILSTINKNPDLVLILQAGMRQSSLKDYPKDMPPWEMSWGDYHVDKAMTKANDYIATKFKSKSELDEDLGNDIFDLIIDGYYPKKDEFSYYVPVGRCHACVHWLKTIAMMTYPKYRWTEVRTEEHSTVVGFNAEGIAVKIFDFCWYFIDIPIDQFIQLWQGNEYFFMSIPERNSDFRVAELDL